jgi:hypothetical protein
MRYHTLLPTGARLGPRAGRVEKADGIAGNAALC